MTKGKNSDMVIVSDCYLQEVGSIKSEGYKKIIAYLLEPRAISSAYSLIEKCIHEFDLVLTFDPYLLENYPDKCRFIPALVPNFIEHPQVYEKSKLCSIVYGRTDETKGHRLRQETLDRYYNFFDAYKTDKTPRTPFKDEWLDDFCYSIAIENCQILNYFTEKILDCFNSGTIPIYWGCPNIDKFFNTDGFITFNSIEELDDILKNLSFEDYQRRLPSIKQNFELAQKYPALNSMGGDPSSSCAMDLVWLQIKDFFNLE